VEEVHFPCAVLEPVINDEIAGAESVTTGTGVPGNDRIDLFWRCGVMPGWTRSNIIWTASFDRRSRRRKAVAAMHNATKIKAQRQREMNGRMAQRPTAARTRSRYAETCCHHVGL
jgi:hypothetical protein